ncbi:L-threonylcarbamoyladenylate synthase type 1 TsaC [Buchnera aphidicola]|uniref:Threonylcarbamoyl-AMP synthase n=1 Tax=Buchnera aphidicola subsp. Schizaphis graminum (strain Sg) TaxID=198804 RepID=TSAC_BUCAP|nr:L-threonylcarbamoyladenylate synthase type 1 TsaC [Buchnera aphidicola]Q8K977.1 RecName: Full=Threonylcarbamoyl-AMP synthase; Short=TC-AMP synthase; AltName: Full=L-threonylcarbamoyladenylate synthase; AltName: Full=t(6)A37 threonylcarbamoyladenosine biosynthesis protein TsaC; AltName: Full=tRNA threonylcarbamoyladenosine biosynthesis protein TsaC [Buchnera aphidicola str. Sg (Schizaphis graminum)]AAM68018.1 hypothetical 20.8 kDa protein [Buchnera aphidicola str. Sg (Schizaphis graminum)]AWI4
MSKDYFLSSLIKCIRKLYDKKIIAYPTEAMFGLGCDPTSEKAVKRLLDLKKRSIKKGLILVASNYNQIKMYINESKLSAQQKKTMFFHWPGPYTFLVPANSLVPCWLTGQFDTIAVRISAHFSIIKLCNVFGKALVSTSANISNMSPCLTREDVLKDFGKDFPVLYGHIGNESHPSKIINIVNGKLIRYV